MCTSCFSAVDAAIANSVIFTAAATKVWTKVTDKRTRRTRLDRQMAAWQADAEYFRAMGLDPMETLGAPPGVPAEGIKPAVDAHVDTGCCAHHGATVESTERSEHLATR